MKNVYIIVITIILLVISFFVGQYIYKISRLDDKVLAKTSEYQQLEEDTKVRTQLTSIAEDIKISPNAIITFKTEYKKCGHLLNEYKSVTENEVNLNENEFKALYKEWEILEFKEKEVVLLKRVNEDCNQHFVIRERDGNVAVYIIDKDNDEILKETTNISTEYLTQLDLVKLREGIRVNGFEELNNKLEDFE